MRQKHVAGEKLFIDFAGKKPFWTDIETSEVHEVELFAACWGASSYLYAEACNSQKSVDFIGAHVRALEFFGGAPEFLVPDNLKSAVTKYAKSKPQINPEYLQMARHYGAYVIPARPRRPRDKGKVEAAVKYLTILLVRVLRRRTFFSLHELSSAVHELVGVINERPFKRLPSQSRRTLFERVDRPAMKPLPEAPYEYTVVKVGVTVGPDYHVLFDQGAYSVPCGLIGAKVDIKVTERGLSTWHKGNLVATHGIVGPGETSTDPAHMTPNHKLWHDADEELVSWADGYSAATRHIARINAESEISSEIKRATASSMRNLCRIDPDRFAQACSKALELNNPSYRTVRLILDGGLEASPVGTFSQEDQPGRTHENVRGPEYFSSRGFV
jgi:hypothetical protein